MYATDMIHCTVNVKELAEKNEEKSIRLENEFFKQFGNEDVVGGEVDVVATARKSQDSKYDYLVEIKVKGVLRITCTRCLDEMNYDTEVEDTVKVVCTNADMETDDEDMLEAPTAHLICLTECSKRLLSMFRRFMCMKKVNATLQ